MILSADKKLDVEYIKTLMENPGTTIPSMLIFGEPGAGKTSFGKHLADELGAKIIFAPCYDGVAAEELVFNWDLGVLADAMSARGTSKGTEALKHGYLLQALTASQKGKVLLLIDEIDKAKPSVDTFLLSYLQECMINDPLTGIVKGNKKNMFIIFTSNKRRELEEALDRRFTIIREFKFPEKKELKEQVSMMVNVAYNETKLNFLIDLSYLYRSLNVSKKPSQNQIADLVQELHYIGISTLSKKDKNSAKVRALLWKMSQEQSDHKLFQASLKKKFPKDTTQYIGSML